MFSAAGQSIITVRIFQLEHFSLLPIRRLIHNNQIYRLKRISINKMLKKSLTPPFGPISHPVPTDRPPSAYWRPTTLWNACTENTSNVFVRRVPWDDEYCRLLRAFSFCSCEPKKTRLSPAHTRNSVKNLHFYLFILYFGSIRYCGRTRTLGFLCKRRNLNTDSNCKRAYVFVVLGRFFPIH